MHIPSVQLVDAARGTLLREDRVAVERHIHDCEGCRDMLRFWRRVASLAESDDRYEPPRTALATVSAYRVTPAQPVSASPLRGPADGWRSLAAMLMFDSFQQALPAGVRTAGSRARQLVYVAAPLLVDLRFETGAPSRRVVLTGQIASTQGPPSRGGGARVAVMLPGGPLTATVANQFGEFHCEFDGRDDLTLAIAFDDGTSVAISLDRLPAV